MTWNNVYLLFLTLPPITDTRNLLKSNLNIQQKSKNVDDDVFIHNPESSEKNISKQQKKSFCYNCWRHNAYTIVIEFHPHQKFSRPPFNKLSTHVFDGLKTLANTHSLIHIHFRKKLRSNDFMIFDLIFFQFSSFSFFFKGKSRIDLLGGVM